MQSADDGADGLGPVLNRLPELRGPREVSELPGGLTNRNYRVRTGSGDFVVRVATGQAQLLEIDRENEYRNSVAAASCGVGAPVIARLREPDVLVVGFLTGHTLTAEQVGTPTNLPRVADACRRLHAGPRFVCDFDMTRVLENYLRICTHRDFALPAGYLEPLPTVGRIRAALAARPLPTVPCNNDLLAGNMIDDGSSIRLIDYEYSGNNDPCFELGNLAYESHLDDDRRAELGVLYWGREARHLLARTTVLGLLGQYGWTLWACIQQATSDLDFDFRGWGTAKYETAVRAFTERDFDRLLEDVLRDD